MVLKCILHHFNKTSKRKNKNLRFNTRIQVKVPKYTCKNKAIVYDNFSQARHFGLQFVNIVDCYKSKLSQQTYNKVFRRIRNVTYGVINRLNEERSNSQQDGKGSKMVKLKYSKNFK